MNKVGGLVVFMGYYILKGGFYLIIKEILKIKFIWDIFKCYFYEYIMVYFYDLNWDNKNLLFLNIYKEKLKLL